MGLDLEARHGYMKHRTHLQAMGEREDTVARRCHRTEICAGLKRTQPPTSTQSFPCRSLLPGPWGSQDLEGWGKGQFSPGSRVAQSCQAPVFEAETVREPPAHNARSRNRVCIFNTNKPTNWPN